MKTIDDLYAYVWQGNDNNCNSYIFAEALSGGKHVLIDPGHLVTPSYGESGLEMLFASMEKDGISGSSIGMVILTHAHPDHCEAAMTIRENQNALVAVHAADEPAYSMLGGKADLFIDEGKLDLRSEKTISLQIYHSPGHTQGHVTVYWPKQKVLIAGDCIFYRSTGRTDFPGGDAGLLSKASIDCLDLI